jgi:outer membrane lipoprotein-sorting protein
MSRQLALWTIAVALAVPSSAQTADEIVAKNLEARGGLEAIKALQSARIHGTMSGGPAEMPFVMQWKRPRKVRFEFTLEGMTAVQAYDGAAGWQTNPFLGGSDPEPLSAAELEQVEEQADFDGDLVDYRDKGHRVELVGRERVAGADAWKLEVTKKSGDVTYLYLDAATYLEIRQEGKRHIRGREIEFETTLGDYKEVGGLVFAHAIESRAKAAPMGQAITFERIELNPDLPDADFAMPAARRPAAVR